MILAVNDRLILDDLVIIVTEDWVEQVVSLSLVTDKLLPAKGIERVVGGTISAQELLVGQSLHRLGLIEGDFAAVDGVTGLSLITHRARVAQVDGCAIAQEAMHTFDSHLGLVHAREGSHFHFRLDARAASEPEG